MFSLQNQKLIFILIELSETKYQFRYRMQIEAQRTMLREAQRKNCMYFDLLLITHTILRYCLCALFAFIIREIDRERSEHCADYHGIESDKGQRKHVPLYEYLHVRLYLLLSSFNLADERTRRADSSFLGE